MKKQWKQISWGECDECCTDDISVLTTCKKEDFAHDGDEVKCNECDCRGGHLVHLLRDVRLRGRILHPRRSHAGRGVLVGGSHRNGRRVTCDHAAER